MTEIEKEARQILNEASGRLPAPYTDAMPRCNHYPLEAVCRALERFKDFRQEVSDMLVDEYGEDFCRDHSRFSRFIIPKPIDPLVEDFGHDLAEQLRAALAKRGLEVREIEG